MSTKCTKSRISEIPVTPAYKKYFENSLVYFLSDLFKFSKIKKDFDERVYQPRYCLIPIVYSRSDPFKV